LGAAAQTLLSNPLRTRPVDFSPIIRRLKAQHHYLYFRPEQGDVVVLRILHEKMDPARHLSDLA